MSITVSTPATTIPINVVEVGNEISTNQLAAITGASSPSASNVFRTTSSIYTATNTWNAPQQFDVTSNSAAALRINCPNGVSASTAVGAFYVSVLNTATNGHAVVIENRGNGDCLRIHDQAADDPTKFVVDNAGNVTLGGSLRLASAALTSAVGAQTYPDELTFIIGSTTYRVPARAI
jgi:hypothetical protein